MRAADAQRYASNLVQLVVSMDTSIIVAIIGGLATVAAAIVAVIRRGDKKSPSATQSSNASGGYAITAGGNVNIGSEMLQGHAELENRKNLACRVVSQTMAMLFVDLMRLLYVASSDIAREANGTRHTEFTDLATLHLRNLESHISRLSESLGTTLEGQSCDLERQLSYMLDDLKVEQNLTGQYSQYLAKMHKIGTELHRFCLGALGESYERSFQRVGAEIDKVLTKQHSAMSMEALDKIWLLRLATQSELLKTSRELEETELYSIKDDMTHRVAIPYFILDYKILRDVPAA